MDNRMDGFLAIGMKKYRQASATLVSFGKEIERRLQAILSERSIEDWGRFVPERTKPIRSTKYWSEYPLLNAKIDGKIGGTDARISIAINWYGSEREYPFYAVDLEPADRYQNEMTKFNWSDDVIWNGRGIHLYANEDDFSLERDFRVLLNELTRFLNSKELEQA